MIRLISKNPSTHMRKNVIRSFFAISGPGVLKQLNGLTGKDQVEIRVS